MTQEMLDLFSGVVTDEDKHKPQPERRKGTKSGTRQRVSHTPAASPPRDSDNADHKPKRKQPRRSTDIDLRMGALRLLFGITDSTPGARERVTIKVRLPADVLATARGKATEAKVPGPTGGRPSVAAVLADLLDRMLVGVRIDDLLAAVATDLGPRAGVVNVTVDSAGYGLLAACAKQVGVTTPELVARVLTAGLRREPPTRQPQHPATVPGLRAAAEDAVGTREAVVAAHAHLPNVDLSRIKDIAKAENVDRPRMIGRLLTEGLHAADRDPLPVITTLTDPQTLVPPATTRARIRVEKHTWLAVLSLTQTLDRGVDEVTSALLTAGLDARARHKGRDTT